MAQPASWVGDTVEEFKKLPPWGKIGVGAAVVGVAGFAFWQYQQSKNSSGTTLPTTGTSSGNNAGIPSGASSGSTGSTTPDTSSMLATILNAINALQIGQTTTSTGSTTGGTGTTGGTTAGTGTTGGTGTTIGNYPSGTTFSNGKAVLPNGTTISNVNAQGQTSIGSIVTLPQSMWGQSGSPTNTTANNQAQLVATQNIPGATNVKQYTDSQGRTVTTADLPSTPNQDYQSEADLIGHSIVRNGKTYYPNNTVNTKSGSGAMSLQSLMSDPLLYLKNYIPSYPSTLPKVK